MPWKETSVVSVREEFLTRALCKGTSFRKLCEEFGISRKTGYKWVERYSEDGRRGLADRSRRPLSSPREVGEDQVCAIVNLKLGRGWGPKKLQQLLLQSHPEIEPVSLSTIKRVLKKTGLVRERKRRRSTECGRIENRIQAQQPNELWTADFKGYWYSAERRRVDPLTVQDAYSRYVLCAQALADGKTQTVRTCFERLFEKHGLPGTIRTDNGSPFASVQAPLGLSQLSAWWVSLGINLDRIRPGHPEENGAHERMHGDLAVEVEQECHGEWEEQQAALEIWRQERNEERPHEALGMKVPAAVYQPSERKWSREEEVELEYPLEYLKRRVSSSGSIKISGVAIRVTQALAKWDVGLKASGPSLYTVWFGPLCLGSVNVKQKKFEPLR